MSTRTQSLVPTWGRVSCSHAHSLSWSCSVCTALPHGLFPSVMFHPHKHAPCTQLLDQSSPVSSWLHILLLTCMTRTSKNGLNSISWRSLGGFLFPLFSWSYFSVQDTSDPFFASYSVVNSQSLSFFQHYQQHLTHSHPLHFGNFFFTGL